MTRWTARGTSLFTSHAVLVIILLSVSASSASAQAAVTWPALRDRFLAESPAVRAAQLAADEARASELTAAVRPNPQWSTSFDQIGQTATGNPFSASTLTTNVSYLHERQHKRELRLQSAQQATAEAGFAEQDLRRTMLSDLRSAFIQVLQAKAFQTLAGENLASYDQILQVSRERFARGDIARIDLDRLELQRVQYESDVQAAAVTLRLAKVALLRLLNDSRTPPEQFDLSGTFDLPQSVPTLDTVRRLALDLRPDLRAARQAVEKARVDHQLAIANGSVDPVIAVDAGFPNISEVWQSYEPPLRMFVGVGATVPLRIFDRNQGEKQRTQLDVTRTERLADAALAQVFADVDSAYTTLTGSFALVQPYKDRYLAEAARVRDTVAFAYQRGGASLLELLQAQQEYRTVQVTYVNLVGATLAAANQLNTAVGQEVLR